MEKFIQLEAYSQSDINLSNEVLATLIFEGSNQASFRGIDKERIVGAINSAIRKNTAFVQELILEEIDKDAIKKGELKTPKSLVLEDFQDAVRNLIKELRLKPTVKFIETKDKLEGKTGDSVYIKFIMYNPSGKEKEFNGELFISFYKGKVDAFDLIDSKINKEIVSYNKMFLYNPDLLYKKIHQDIS